MSGDVRLLGVDFRPSFCRLNSSNSLPSICALLSDVGPISALHFYRLNADIPDSVMNWVGNVLDALNEIQRVSLSHVVVRNRYVRCVRAGMCCGRSRDLY